MQKFLSMFEGPKGKVSAPRVLFFSWITFLLFNLGYLNYIKEQLTEIPAGYFEMTALLAGTYTVKRYMERDGGIEPKSK